jgi:hypothetical protein
MTREFLLQAVRPGDLPIFFAYQLDREANQMAAFTAKDPTDRAAFDAHWQRIMADPTVIIRTILVNGQVAGSILSYEDEGTAIPGGKSMVLSTTIRNAHRRQLEMPIPIA